MINARRLFRLTLLFLLIPLSTVLTSAQLRADYADVPYVSDGSPYQVLDIYLPTEGDAPFPTILQFHGRSENPGNPLYMRSHLLEQGYALVGVDYNDFDFAQGAKDSFCALAWLHTRGSEYNLDATRTVAIGFSLGGIMVSYLGTVDEPDIFLEGCPHTIDEQAPLLGAIVLSGGAVWLGIPDNVLSSFTGFSLADVATMRESIGQIPANEWADTLQGDEREFASRIASFWIDGSEPPFLLIHGEIDRTLSYEESIHFAEELAAANSPVELLLLPDYGHMNLVGHPVNVRAVKPTETVDAFLEAIFETDDAAIP